MIPWAHTDRTDLTGFLCGWEISQRLSTGLLQWLTWIPLCRGRLTRIPQISQVLLCGWEISQNFVGALIIGALGVLGALGNLLTR